MRYFKLVFEHLYATEKSHGNI